MSYEADLTVLLRRWRPTPLLAALCSDAILHTPRVRSATNAGSAETTGTLAGLLVDTPMGLLLPRVVIPRKPSQASLTATIGDAVERARSGRLDQADVGPRAFTLSNLGMFPVESFVGVIAVPDVLLVSAGQARVRPVWDAGAWTPRTLINLTVTMDHRALDGSDAAALLVSLDASITRPERWEGADDSRRETEEGRPG